MDQAKRLLETPEGRQLLQHFQQHGGDALRQAGQAAQAGDTAAAQKAIAPLLSDPAVRQLLQSLSETMNRG